jgi:hypothetical protein
MQDRRVYSGEWSKARPEQYHTCLTPNGNAARTLGIKHLSLENLAVQVLGAERIAHPLAVQRLLFRAPRPAIK